MGLSRQVAAGQQDVWEQTLSTRKTTPAQPCVRPIPPPSFPLSLLFFYDHYRQHHHRSGVPFVVLFYYHCMRFCFAGSVMRFLILCTHPLDIPSFDVILMPPRNERSRWYFTFFLLSSSSICFAKGGWMDGMDGAPLFLERDTRVGKFQSEERPL